MRSEREEIYTGNAQGILAGKIMTIINGIEIEVERKLIRSIRLSIKPPDARVHLSIPFYLPEREAEAFLLRQWDWICRTREKVLNMPRLGQPEYISGEEHLLFGQRYRLQTEPVTSGPNSVTLLDGVLVMRCRPAATRENRQALLREWYREQLQPVVGMLVEEWRKRLGEAPVTWRIRLMRSEWGSCTARKRHLLFNLDLVRVPVECIEYVVVHELTHLAVQNHGPAFQALMTQRLPNWKNLRKQLNDSIIWNTRSKQSEC